MRAGETDLEMIKRHVKEGMGHIAKQRALIIRLKAHDLPVEEAKALLDIFEDIQLQHEDHLARAMSKNGEKSA